jgi:hypothetical protein
MTQASEEDTSPKGMLEMTPEAQPEPTSTDPGAEQ